MAKKEPEKGDDARKPKKNHLISRKKVRDFLADHPGSKEDAVTFRRWCVTVEQATWLTFADIKATFGGAAQVGELVVFNVGGNKYRVIASVKFRKDKPAWVYIKHVLTHKEYDKGGWKDSS